MEIAACQELRGKSPSIVESGERVFHAMDSIEFEPEEFEVAITKSMTLQQADLVARSFQRTR